ncbi:MAG TPA: hypothetical protein VL742_05570 [Casimicrobiaceae bacterium]|nr:hypothetical protein [Casimicrobiaceae bacterium]
MKSSIVIAIAAIALLSACGQGETSHASSVNPAFRVAASGLAPPAPPERGPIPPNANAAAPGTNASKAFANEHLDPLPKQPLKDGPVQHLYVEAQEAAAKAPDTASADAAKREVLKEGTSKAAS